MVEIKEGVVFQEDPAVVSICEQEQRMVAIKEGTESVLQRPHLFTPNQQYYIVRTHNIISSVECQYKCSYISKTLKPWILGI